MSDIFLIVWCVSAIVVILNIIDDKESFLAAMYDEKTGEMSDPVFMALLMILCPIFNTYAAGTLIIIFINQHFDK